MVAAYCIGDCGIQLGFQMIQSKENPRKVICPECGRSEGVEKVSTIYLAGIRVKRSSTSGQIDEDLASQVLEHLPGLTAQDLHSLSRDLAPPSSGKAGPIRPVHPDLVVLVFTGLIPIFITGIVNQQPAVLIPVLIILALAYGLYFYKRRVIIAKFIQAQEEQKEKQALVERGIQNWMKLYYCSREEGVFIPGRRELVSVNELLNYLYNKI